MAEPRFKPGDEVFYPEYGCGTVLEVHGPYTVVVKFGKDVIRSLLVTEHLRLARDEDKNWPPRSVPELEPICEPGGVTLEHLEDSVSRWEVAVGYIESGADDDTDEYTHDLFNRYILHGVLNGFACQNLAVPDAPKARIDEADKRFMASTFVIDTHVWGGTRIYDKTIFWYYYRWPLKPA